MCVCLGVTKEDNQSLLQFIMKFILIQHLNYE